MEALSETGRRAIEAGMDEAEWRLRVALAAYFRINAVLGWEDSFNTHATARVPGREEHFLINPWGLRFDEIRASDLIKVDVDGRIVGETPHTVNEAGFVIHSAIHLGRADARCIVHTHSLAGMAVAANADGLLPIGLFALGFHGRLSLHPFEGASGRFNMGERERLAQSLGPTNNAMLMQSHGLLTVGRTVAEAFVWMYRLDKACQVQLASYGQPGRYLYPSDAARRHTVTGTDQFVSGYGTDGAGDAEFAAWRRAVDRRDPSYRE